ncbi:uncharacterized [Tachysurus ichikawai]
MLGLMLTVGTSFQGHGAQKHSDFHQVCFHPLARLESAKKNHSELNREWKSVTVSLVKYTLGRISHTSDLLSHIIGLSKQIQRRCEAMRS